MKLNLKQIFDIPGESADISYKMSLFDYELYGVKPFAAPISVKGKVYNEAGIVKFKCDVEFTLKLPCDRCLDIFEREYHYSFDEILITQQTTDENKYIIAKDGILDVDELCLTDILLSLPTKQLCKEECKGLCPICGVNLNHTSCNCQKSEACSKHTVLGELLQ